MSDGGFDYTSTERGERTVTFGVGGKVVLGAITALQFGIVGLLTRFPTADQFEGRARLVDERFVQLIDRVESLEHDIERQNDLRARLLVLETRMNEAPPTVR